MNKVLLVLPLFLCCGLMLPPYGQSLDNGASWFDWQYRLDEPGARGRGMGGTTVAVTNDASAALANPAALTDVAQAELVVEARAVHLDELNTAGQVDDTGNPLQMGLQAKDSNQINLSHAAMAIPLGKSRSVLAIFYHRLALMDRTIIASDPRDSAVIQVHEPMFAVDEVGASLAREFFSGTLSLGLSGSLATLNMDSKATVGSSSLAGATTGGEYLFYGHQSEQEPIWRMGLLWKPTRSLRIGIKQTLMPTIDYKLSTVDSTWLTTDLANSRCTPAAFSDGWVCESTLPVPDTLSVGIAYLLSDRLTLAGELKSIKYSVRTHKLNAIFVTPGSVPEADFHPADFSAEDVVEIHLGVEWLSSVMSHPVQFRTGYYFDPAHDILYRGSDATTAAIFYGGDDVHHATLGVGIPFGKRNRLDAAIDIASDGRHQGLLSLLWRF